MFMATTTKRWTLDELHSLPDDGNKYELIHGELFVTPPPTDDHETICSRLTRILDPYVAANGLGHVYHPRAVLRSEGSEVEPDLMGRAEQSRGSSWDHAPIPILIVEVLAGSTRRRDNNQKRGFHVDTGVAEYWMVNPERRTITVVRAAREDHVASTELLWYPPGVRVPLAITVARVFGVTRSCRPERSEGRARTVS